MTRARHWKQILNSALHEGEWEYARSSGPGGQKVNKTETKATFRWSIYKSLGFEDIEYVIKHLRNSLTKLGELVVSSERYRDRESNKRDVVEKLHALFEKKFFVPPTRKKTKPTKASQVKRLKSKERRKEVKGQRQKVRY